MSNVEFEYAVCAPPAERVRPEFKLDPNLCPECELVEPENDCSAGPVCETKCDGSFWENLFCGGLGGAFGVCVPEGTVTACE